MEINIKQNDVQPNIADCTIHIINELDRIGCCCIYRTDAAKYHLSLDNLRDIGRAFKDKGYHAKINHFVESWKGYQCLAVSKTPFGSGCGRLIYEELL